MFSLDDLDEPWYMHDKRNPSWRQCGYGRLIEAFTLKRKPGVVRLRVGYDNEQVIDTVYNEFHDVYENCTKENANSVDFDCKSKDEFDGIVESVIKFLETSTLLHKKSVSSKQLSPITVEEISTGAPVPGKWVSVLNGKTVATKVKGIDVAIAVSLQYRVIFAYGENDENVLIWDAVMKGLPHIKFTPPKRGGVGGGVAAPTFSSQNKSEAIDVAKEVIGFIILKPLEKSGGAIRGAWTAPERKNITKSAWWLERSLTLFLSISKNLPDLATRGSLQLDGHIGNKFQVVGRSVACRNAGLQWGSGGIVREHVIPVGKVTLEALRMIVAMRKGKKITIKQILSTIAEFLETNLKIVAIMPLEAKRLNSMKGLQSNMPAAWAWGDDPFARLVAAGIEWEPTS